MHHLFESAKRQRRIQFEIELNVCVCVKHDDVRVICQRPSTTQPHISHTRSQSGREVIDSNWHNWDMFLECALHLLLDPEFDWCRLFFFFATENEGRKARGRRCSASRSRFSINVNFQKGLLTVECRIRFVDDNHYSARVISSLRLSSPPAAHPRRTKKRIYNSID